MRIERVIQPTTWAGRPHPNDPRVMVCGACATPAECSIASRCKRARDEDYARADRALLGLDVLGSDE